MRQKVRERLATLLTWVCRVCCGGVFLFSGFVKAIDPEGTVLKIHDYLAALSFSLPENLVVAAAFALVACEFMLGLFLLAGCFRKGSPVLALLMMAGMLPLTLWIALKDPVADCGCFGDAVVLSNWATFWKNVALTAGLVWLLLRNRRTYSLITPSLQWISLVATGCFISFVAWRGYEIQPYIDFRPWPVGTPLLADSGEEESSFRFIYRKGEKTVSVGADDELPSESEGWEFVGREEVDGGKFVKEENGHGEDFSIRDRESGEEESEEVIDSAGEQILLLVPDPAAVSPSILWRITRLHRLCSDGGIDFIGIFGPGKDSDMEKLSTPDYPVYTADDTAIRMLARGNPAVVYLKDGKVEWKSSLEWTDLGENDRKLVLSRDAYNGRSVLRNLIMLWLLVLGVLIAASFMVTRFAIENGRKVITRGGSVLLGGLSWLGKAVPRKKDGPSHD